MPLPRFAIFRDTGVEGWEFDFVSLESSQPQAESQARILTYDTGKRHYVYELRFAVDSFRTAVALTMETLEKEEENGGPARTSEECD